VSTKQHILHSFAFLSSETAQSCQPHIAVLLLYLRGWYT